MSCLHIHITDMFQSYKAALSACQGAGYCRLDALLVTQTVVKHWRELKILKHWVEKQRKPPTHLFLFLHQRTPEEAALQSFFVPAVSDACTQAGECKELNRPVDLALSDQLISRDRSHSHLYAGSWCHYATTQCCLHLRVIASWVCHISGEFSAWSGSERCSCKSNVSVLCPRNSDAESP